MNSISVINPYKWHGQWVFDDPAKDLDKEALVAGADTLLDFLTEGGIECVIVFSGNKFPGAEHMVEKLQEHGPEGGTTYYSKAHDHPLWLCPALLKYFETPPDEIWFKLNS